MTTIASEIDKKTRNTIEGIVREDAPYYIERANDEDPGYGHGFMHSEGDYYCPFE